MNVCVCVYVCMYSFIHSFIHLLLSLCFFYVVSFPYLSFFVSRLCSCFLFSVTIVGIVTRISSERPTNLGSILGGDKIILSSLKRPVRPSVPASLQFNAHRY
jgi:hypothetical protein